MPRVAVFMETALHRGPRMMPFTYAPIAVFAFTHALVASSVTTVVPASFAWP
jgi:hypothetical protein